MFVSLVFKRRCTRIRCHCSGMLRSGSGGAAEAGRGRRRRDLPSGAELGHLPSSSVSGVILCESTPILKTLKWTLFKPIDLNALTILAFLKSCFSMNKWVILLPFLLTSLSFVCSSFKMNLRFCFMQSVARWWLDKKQPDLPRSDTELPQLLLKGNVPFWMKSSFWGSQ